MDESVYNTYIISDHEFYELRVVKGRNYYERKAYVQDELFFNSGRKLDL